MLKQNCSCNRNLGAIDSPEEFAKHTSIIDKWFGHNPYTLENLWSIITSPKEDVLSQSRLRPTPPPPAPTVYKMYTWNINDLYDARRRDLKNWANPLFTVTDSSLRSDGLPKSTGDDDIKKNQTFDWQTLGLGVVAGLVTLALVKRI